jgi:hypothetical protein
VPRRAHPSFGPSTAAVAPPIAPPQVPFRRDALGLEFIPALNHAWDHACTGQPYTKVGTPTKVVGESAFDFGAGDAIVFANEVLDDLLNADPAGFTVFVAIAPRSAPLGSFKSVLTHTDQSDYPLSVYTEDGLDGQLKPHGDVAYSTTEYGGNASYGGNSAIFPADAQVFTVRYDRAHVIGGATGFGGALAGEIHHDDPVGGRLRWYADGVNTPGDQYTVADDDGYSAGVLAGTIDDVPAGFLYIGDDTNGAPHPRIGGVWVYTDALSDAEIAAISDWINLAYPLTDPAA